MGAVLVGKVQVGCAGSRTHRSSLDTVGVMGLINVRPGILDKKYGKGVSKVRRVAARRVLTGMPLITESLNL